MLYEFNTPMLIPYPAFTKPLQIKKTLGLLLRKELLALLFFQYD